MDNLKWASIGAVLIALIVMMFNSGGKTIRPETAVKLKAQFDDLTALFDPLCIVEGPFPKPTHEFCFQCEKLLSAKLIEKREGNYALTPFGRSIYRQDADARFNAAYRKQNERAKRSQTLTLIQQAMLSKRPRFCLGETYAETLVDALSVMELGTERYQSAKIVPGVRDPHPDILDERLAPLAIPCASAQAGKPMLCKQQLVTFQYFRDEVEFTDVRYGPWVNEK